MKLKRVAHIAIAVDSMRQWRTGHGGSNIIFLDPAATGNVVIELAELVAGH